MISIHTPLAGSDYCLAWHSECAPISIHTPLAGSDVTIFRALSSSVNFNPHSPCGERRAISGFEHFVPAISIHTPLAGSDGVSRRRLPIRRYFNPHSPCGERHDRAVGAVLRLIDFNPHSPCGERLAVGQRHRFLSGISIHTPLAGSDFLLPLVLRHSEISIHTPLAGSDYRAQCRVVASDISIHTPLAGSDISTPVNSSRKYDFNPHSPCGERPAISRPCS